MRWRFPKWPQDLKRSHRISRVKCQLILGCMKFLSWNACVRMNISLGAGSETVRQSCQDTWLIVRVSHANITGKNNNFRTYLQLTGSVFLCHWRYSIIVPTKDNIGIDVSRHLWMATTNYPKLEAHKTTHESLMKWAQNRRLCVLNDLFCFRLPWYSES